MALSQQLIDLLNKFADSQPALRLPGEPFGSSNPSLGDALNDAFSKYVPGDSGDWDGDPVSVQEALDRLAALAAVLNSDPVP